MRTNPFQTPRLMPPLCHPTWLATSKKLPTPCSPITWIRQRAQQMILDSVKALFRTTGQPIPPGLSRRVSSLATREQLVAFLTDIWPKSTAKPLAPKALERSVLEGLLAHIPGGARLMSAKERTVEEQLAGNRYVGLHINLGMNEKEKRPAVFRVIDNGPADRAGVKKDDLLEMIDGLDTKDMTVQEVVDHLRGQEGTSVTIKVRQPKAAISRTYTIKRGQHPRSTVLGVRKGPGGEWDCTLDRSIPVCYLRIEQIAASTPHDLRKLARQIDSQGHCGVILDLRRVAETSVHPAALLADTLLSSGVIGRVRTAERDVTYRAEPDAVFRNLPIVVLVDQNTAGTGEWLAAALQDNHRATIVGTPTYGASGLPPGPNRRSFDVTSSVKVGDGSWFIELTTGFLARGDGRRLSSDAGAGPAFNAARPNEVTTGVKPDHPLGLAGTRGARSWPARPREPGEEPSLAEDPAVQEAVRLLRIALEKFI